jgi:spore coat protein U-like protein
MNLNKNIKQESKFRLRTTTALSCLFTTVMIYNSSMKQAAATPGTTTATGTFTASTSVGSSCTFSAADTMDFGAYANAELTASSVVTANCTNGTTASIYFTDTTGMVSTAYKMYLGGTSNSTASSYIEATFYNNINRSSGQMTSGAATISHTGTGASATAGTIYGKVAALQGTDKLGGAYSRILTLQISY